MRRIWGRFMPRRPLFFLIGALVLVLSPVLMSAGDATASHSWGSYHWARKANPFTLKLGDNVSSTWDAHLRTASSDWSQSVVMDTTVVAGKTSPKSCRGVNGTVQVCNSAYGTTGWLGVAQIWVSGSHITKGVAKMNDTYFSTAPYKSPAWRQFVMCQEVGHTFGLDHQDEVFSNPNLGTCMDYTNDPDGTLYQQSSNLHPNAHDYEQLVLIYAHLDSTTTVAATTISSGAAAQAAGQDGDDWGTAVKVDGKGRPSVFVKNENGGKKITWVYWADAN
jgi:hypothetical protein